MGSDSDSDTEGSGGARWQRIRRLGLRIAVRLSRTAGLLVTLLAVIALLARYTDFIDRYLVFFPERDIFQDPGDRGLIFEDVTFAASGGVSLHGWFVPGPGDKTLVWFHGNAGNISHRVDNLYSLHTRLGVNIFIFDYRGFGKSEGSPSERGTYLDADAALEYLRSREDVDTNKLVLFGRSVGCAVAAEAATKIEAQAVILESPFTSARAMARKVYPFLPGIGLLVAGKLDTLSRIGRVHAPIMVIHGDADEIVPFEMGRELFEAANHPKRFYAIGGAGHNDTYLVGGEPYLEALVSFVEDPAGEDS